VLPYLFIWVQGLVNKLRITLLIIIIDALLFASLALLVSIDRIVNSTLYNYGLQYDPAWASTYQIYFDATAILIAISTIAIILMEAPNLFWKKEKGTTGFLASPKVSLEKDIPADESELSVSVPKDSEFPPEAVEKESTEEKEPTEFEDLQEIPIEKEKDTSAEKNIPSASTPKDSELPQPTEKKELTGFWATQKLPGVFCRYCGFENEFDAVFCEKCGKSLTKKKKKTSASITEEPSS
jgi:outer membrane biosynthesis protein TonB